MDSNNFLAIAFTPDPFPNVKNCFILNEISNFKKKIIDYKFNENIIVLYCDNSSFFSNQYALTAVLSKKLYKL